MKSVKNNLEDFIHKNREVFDEFEPSASLWNRLEKEIEPATGSTHRVIPIKWARWAIAASIVLAVASGYLFINRPTDTGIAAIDTSAGHLNNPAAITGNPEPVQQEASIAETPLVPQANSPRANKNEPTPYEESDETVAKEMYHYTRLIELKQKEIADIRQENPELYSRFSKDLETLEQSYEGLREKQKKGINSEQLLEAMIQNLKTQTDLLNKQLEVTRHIKNKRSENEKFNTL